MDRIMPIDLERPNLRKRFRGYDVNAVDTLLRGAARTLHEQRMENEALRERLASQTEELERARAAERMTQDVLLSAQRAADETRASAHRQADAMLEEARVSAMAERVNAQQQILEVRSEIERLRADRVRLEVELRALLERYLRELGPAPSLTLVEGNLAVVAPTEPASPLVHA